MPVEFLNRSTNSPIDLEALKQHLRLKVDANDVYELEDSVLALLISAACEAYEYQTKTTLLTSTLKFSYTHFKRIIEMPRPPLQEINEVRYMDEKTGQWTVVNPANYFHIATKTVNPGMIVFADDFVASPPVPDPQHPYPVELTYKAGFGDTTTDIPAAVRLALMNTIGTYYMQRESVLVNYSGSITIHKMASEMAHLMKGYSAAKRFG